MKRQLISLMIMLPLLSLFFTFVTYAQTGNPILVPDPVKPKPIRGGRPASGRRPAGLSNVEYTDRYRKIYYDYTSSKATLNETVTSLEELVKLAGDDSVRSITYQFLGLLYLHGLKDAEKAEGAMERAIRANGSALIEISFDNKWRQMTKSRSGQYDFEDVGRGWIKIESGRLTLTDLKSQPLLNDKAPASLTGQQIKEVSKTLNSAYPLVKITTDNSKRPYLFAAGSKLQVEADLVIKLIQKHVLGKATAQVQR